MNKNNLPIELAKELFSLDEEKGVLFWAKKTSKKVIVGTPAGQHRSDGYISIGVDGRRYLAHRIIFALVNGYYPDEIDHADGDQRNNHPSNLREATRSQNNMNRAVQCNNSSGAKGVYLHRNSGKWHARIKVGGKYISLKYHTTMESARKAYEEASASLHGEFARGAY